MKKEEKQQRPESYPKPSQTDLQLRDQPEFIEPDANLRREETPISNDRPQEQELRQDEANRDRDV